MKYSEATKEQALANIDYIDRRWKQLNELEIKRGDTALNYLFLVSGGAAAATLTYIGNLAKDGTSAPPSAFWMLGLFSVALLLVGFLKICMAFEIEHIFLEWRKTVLRYYADEITWSEALGEDGRQVRGSVWTFRVLVVLAWIFIAIGIFVGIVNLTEESTRVRTEKAIGATSKTSEASTRPAAENRDKGLGGGRGEPAEVGRSRAEQPATATAKEVTNVATQKTKKGE